MPGDYNNGRHFADHADGSSPIYEENVNFPPFRANSAPPARHIDLLGVCNFFIKTNDPKLLQYFPFESPVAVAPYQSLLDESYRFYNDNMRVIGSLLPIRTPEGPNSLVHAASMAIWGTKDTFITVTTRKRAVKVDQRKYLQRGGIARFMGEGRNADMLKLYLRAGERRFLEEEQNSSNSSSSSKNKSRSATSSSASASASASSSSSMGNNDTTTGGQNFTTGRQKIEDIISSDESLDAAYNQLKKDAHSIYQPLSPFHIYVLANALRRPIVVYSSGAGLAHRMRGVYLPTMYPPEDTYPFPLTLLYIPFNKPPAATTAAGSKSNDDDEEEEEEDEEDDDDDEDEDSPPPPCLGRFVCLMPLSADAADDDENRCSTVPLCDPNGDILPIPYGWVGRNTPEHAAAKTRGLKPRIDLSFTPLLHEQCMSRKEDPATACAGGAAGSPEMLAKLISYRLPVIYRTVYRGGAYEVLSHSEALGPAFAKRFPWKKFDDDSPSRGGDNKTNDGGAGHGTPTAGGGGGGGTNGNGYGNGGGKNLTISDPIQLFTQGVTGGGRPGALVIGGGSNNNRNIMNDISDERNDGDDDQDSLDDDGYYDDDEEDDDDDDGDDGNTFPPPPLDVASRNLLNLSRKKGNELVKNYGGSGAGKGLEMDQFLALGQLVNKVCLDMSCSDVMSIREQTIQYKAFMRFLYKDVEHMPLTWRYLNYRFAHDGDDEPKYPFAERCPFHWSRPLLLRHPVWSKSRDVWFQKSLDIAEEFLDEAKALKQVADLENGVIVVVPDGDDDDHVQDNSTTGTNGNEAAQMLKLIFSNPNNFRTTMGNENNHKKRMSSSFAPPPPTTAAAPPTAIPGGAAGYQRYLQDLQDKEEAAEEAEIRRFARDHNGEGSDDGDWDGDDGSNYDAHHDTVEKDVAADLMQGRTYLGRLWQEHQQKLKEQNKEISIPLDRVISQDISQPKLRVAEDGSQPQSQQASQERVIITIDDDDDNDDDSHDVDSKGDEKVGNKMHSQAENKIDYRAAPKDDPPTATTVSNRFTRTKASAMKSDARAMDARSPFSARKLSGSSRPTTLPSSRSTSALGHPLVRSSPAHKKTKGIPREQEEEEEEGNNGDEDDDEDDGDDEDEDDEGEALRPPPPSSTLASNNNNKRKLFHREGAAATAGGGGDAGRGAGAIEQETSSRGGTKLQRRASNDNQQFSPRGATPSALLCFFAEAATAGGGTNSTTTTSNNDANNHPPPLILSAEDIQRTVKISLGIDLVPLLQGRSVPAERFPLCSRNILSSSSPDNHQEKRGSSSTATTRVERGGGRGGEDGSRRVFVFGFQSVGDAERVFSHCASAETLSASADSQTQASGVLRVRGKPLVAASLPITATAVPVQVAIVADTHDDDDIRGVSITASEIITAAALTEELDLFNGADDDGDNGGGDILSSSSVWEFNCIRELIPNHLLANNNGGGNGDDDYSGVLKMFTLLAEGIPFCVSERATTMFV